MNSLASEPRILVGAPMKNELKPASAEYRDGGVSAVKESGGRHPFAARLFRPFKSKPKRGASGANAEFDSKTGDAAATGDKLNAQRLDETLYGPASDHRPMSFTFPPGSQPLPPYTIRRGVGVGGFGEVYFAVSEAGKEVALKRIQRNLEIELRGVSQCLNLKHPNLVSLYDICRDEDGGAWVIMEYVAGQNLRQILDQNPNGLPESEARRWFAGIAAGVEHLHGAGLVHRDLKPGNIFDDMGVVKVGDYGLSKYISSSQRGGHTESVGTFHYMAPEIGRGKYGREIDVYALGIMLYELLTGRVPFDGESCHEIIVKHLTALPELDGVSSPYRETILAALDKDPAKRPATVTEMLASLGLHGSAANPSPGTAAAAERLGPESLSSADVVQPASRLHEPVARGPFARAFGATQPASSSAIPPSGQATAAAPSASPSDEPLMRAVKKSMTDLSLWWQSLERSPRSRFWIGALLAFVLFVNTHWLLPALSILAIIYAPYYIIRQMVLHVNEQPSYARAHQLASQAPQSNKPPTKNQWRSQVRHTLRAKHTLVRMAELNTSWLASSLTVLTISLAAGVIGLRSGGISPSDIATYLWMALVILIGANGILGLGKLWERDEGEGLPRRLVLAGIGAGVGLAAFAINQFFMLSLVAAPSEFLGNDLPQALYQDDRVIRASGMMAHFALLFGGIRWWKSVDPLRRTRLSLWSVAVVCVAAWGVQQVLPVPQPAGLMIAGGLAIATQMSAPWINPRTFRTTPAKPNAGPEMQI